MEIAQLIVNHLPVGVSLLDEELRFILVNERQAHINGIDAQHTIGLSLSEALPTLPDTLEASCRRVLATGKEESGSLVHVTTPASQLEQIWKIGYHPLLIGTPPRKVVMVTVEEVTEQALLDAQIRERDDRTRRVLDNLFAFVGVLAPDGTLIEANKAPLQAAGIQLEEVRGQKFWDTYWWSYDPAVQKRLKKAVSRAIAGETSRYDAVVRMANDTRMPIDFMLAPLRNEKGQITHLIPSAIDIQQRVASEQALRENEALLRNVFDNAADGLMMVADKGIIELINQRMIDLCGYSRQELIGASTELLVPEEERPDHVLVRQRFQESIHPGVVGDRRPMQLRSKGGEVFPVEVGFTRITTSKGSRMLATVVDVRVQEKHRRMLQESLAEKTALLNEVHHRVKNNLQIVVSLLSMQAIQAPPEASEVLSICRHRVHTMALIHQLLYEQSNFASLDVRRYLQQLMNLLSESLSLGSRIGLELDVAPLSLNMQKIVPLGLLVNELVMNSAKHAFPSGWQGVPQVRLELTEKNGEVLVEISDNGSGIPSTMDPKQVRSLGLQMIPLFVSQLGGTWELHRSPGTTWRIRFPLD